MAKSVLSKSTFIKGLQCEKQLYLYKHHYNWQDAVTESQQAVFDRGHNVGELAQKLYLGGVDASRGNPREYQRAVEYTQKLIEEGKEVIYEAAFLFNEVLVFADIIVKDGDSWNVYEVKSSTSVSETYIKDISVQYYVMKNAGLMINDLVILYINSEYIRCGSLNLSELFKLEQVRDVAIQNQSWVIDEVERLKEVISEPEIPAIKIGLQCFDPYDCSFIGYCWKHIPENSVFEISGMWKKKMFELYDQGIVRLEDIQDDLQLPEGQRLQIESYKNGEITIEKDLIKEFLSSIYYPLYFMDFETFQPAVPLYDNSRPYQQIPFQYSLHFQARINDELQHFEFLADTGSDPRILFIEKLLKDTKSAGQIVVYNKAFEKRILSEIANDFPDYADEIGERISRIVDLMIPFQKKWYYTPEMKGSYSIKYVLPALLPELSYEGMEVADGGMAQRAFENLFDETDMFKIEEIRKNLLEYCKLDTLAMVKILNELYKI